MKCLFILIYTLLSISLKAQQDKFISYSSQVTTRNDKGEPIHTEQKSSKGIPVILDYKNNMLFTGGQALLSVQLDTMIRHYKESNGDKVEIFIGRDQANQKCAVVFTVYNANSSFDATIDVSYQRMDLVFGLKHVK